VVVDLEDRLEQVVVVEEQEVIVFQLEQLLVVIQQGLRL
tara:strand:+ start:30 stop:146 length:117 start_codon:yes stop_codon:yes gene_type:complete